MDNNYHGQLMRRLGMIESLGNIRPTPARPSMSGGSPVGSSSPVGGGGGDFESFINSIARQESGGNYGARNKDSGAMGKYQIMPSNLGGNKSGWDYEALGYDITPNQFMGDPQLQEKIARYKLAQYYKQYGASGAATAWYGGPGAVGNRSIANSSQGAYPTIAGYANSILRGMGG